MNPTHAPVVNFHFQFSLRRQGIEAPVTRTEADGAIIGDAGRGPDFQSRLVYPFYPAFRA